MGGHPERSHYLQRAYLDGFSDESTGKLWVYRKGARIPEAKRAETFCRIKGYYRHYISGGKIVDLEQSSLFQEVESVGITAIRNLQGAVTLSLSERRAIARFLALSLIRTPAFEAAFLSGVLHRMDELARSESLPLLPSYAEEMQLQFAKERTPNTKPKGTLSFATKTITMNRAMHVTLIVSQLEEIARKLEGMAWKVLAAPAGLPFITTDNPWAPVAHDGRPLKTRKLINPQDCACVFFPLRRDLCLKARGGGQSFARRSMNPDEARWVNAYVMANAFEFKICSIPDILFLLPPGSHWN